MSVIAKDGRLRLAPPVATVRFGSLSAGHGYEACWSDRMQMTGQVECKRVVKSVQLPRGYESRVDAVDECGLLFWAGMPIW